MCEQTEIIYLDGDVVWVKLGSCWWPGEVCGFDKLPPGVLNSFRKKPIAVVKFFQEESFEYVKNINFIYKYNCSRKNEFIKKGLDLYRSKHTHMEKFPEDVSMAEQRTGGNPDIITDEEFLPKKKESYANIFGSPGDSSASTKKNTPGRKGRLSGTPLKWKSKSDSHDSSTQKITHPRILQKALKGKSDYRAHILVQKSTTCQSPCTPNSAGDISGSTTDGEETPKRIETSSCSPSPSSSQTPGLYSCHACTFTTTRLNVMILHNKSHSANFVPYTPIKKPKMKSKSKSVTIQINDEDIMNTSPVSKKKKSIKFESKPRGRPKLMDYIDSSSPLKTSNKDKSILSPPKRKYAKTKEKEAKKPKTDVEIKNSLLADWNEDSDEESMDVLSSLKLSQNISDSKKTSLAENKDDSQNQIEITDKTSCDIDESDVSIKSLKIGEKRPEKREQTSCFDFEEDEDLQIERLGRKIPRLTAKSEEISIKSMDASIETSNTISDASAENAASSEKGSSLGPSENSSINYDSLQSEINDLLNETKVPELPTIPSMSNFQKSKLVKVPDKEKTNEPPPGKSIFKTKTFFRSRHSRSQDAIEKYVADNTSIDKPPTYMEDTIEAEKSSDHPSESLSDTVSQSSEGSLVEVLPVPAQTDSVKITKYAPKIQLKKMNAALTNKNKCTTNDEDSKNSSTTPTIEDTDERFSDNISVVKIDEDEKCEVIAPVKLFDNDEMLNKNCTQASVKSVNVMDTHCKSRNISDIVEKCPKALSAFSRETIPIESNSQISESLAIFPSSTSHVLNDKENSDNSVINEMITEGVKFNSAKSETLKHENLSDDMLKEKNLTLSLDTDMADANIIEKKVQNTTDDKKLSEDVIVKDELKTISTLPLKSSKLFQILDDKTKKKSPLKIISTKIIKPQGKEKILNFDVGSSQSKGASTQKQKIVIRRATPQHSDSESLSSKNSGKWNDDDVQTFTIEGSSESNDDLLDPQIKKVNKGSPKSNYPNKREEKQNEDVLFDINAMPIVLSNESLENEDTASKSILGNNSKRPETIMTFKTATKPECSDKPKSFKPSIIVKSVLEKTNSPNILSKSPKGKTTKHVLVMDKTTGERKLVKAEDISEKQILQSEGKVAQTANITGKLGGAGDSEIFGSNSLKPITNTTKIIQNKLLSDTPSGSTIMIITKGQGGQSKVVLTPDNPKFLLSKGKIHQMAVAPQNVTPKSTIVTSTINRTKSSHSIINYSSQILNSEAPNLIVSDKSQQQLRAISKQKGTILNSKGQLVLPGNGSKRTILTTMPGQAILTSKGQLIAPQSSVITSTSKLTSNVNKPTTLIAAPNQPLRQLKAVQPQKTLGKFRQETILPSKCNTMLFKTNKSVNQNQTIIQGQLKDSSILLPQKPGTVMHLTTAQFQHLQKTGQLITAPNQRLNLSHNKSGKLQQKFILHKYNMGSKSEQSENNNSSIDRYPSPVPPLAPIHSDLNLNNQKLKENTISSFENEANQQNTTEISMKSAEDDPKISDNDDSCDNLDKLIPATIIPTRKRDSKELLQKADSKSSERLINKINETGNIYNQEISSLLSQELTKNAETKGSADTQIQQTATSLEEPQRQLIAIPAETIGGPPNSFFLCVEDNGTLTPIDNQPLVLENNQLVPMGMPAAAASEASNDSESLSASTNIEIPKSGMKDLNAQQVSEIPIDQTQQNILLNIGDQQILIDHQTLLSLLTEDGQPLVTNDGQQLVFQGSSQQILAALASNPELAGLLGSTQQIIVPATTESFNFSSEVQTNVNQDILAAALAGTEVFPQDSLIHESIINIVTSGAEPVLMEIDTNPNIQNINPAPTVHTNVFETSSTLNQPIMSPLEIPTKKRSDDKTVDSGLLAISKNSNVPKNLEDSLAVIGVSTANVPTSLELPITVTNPRIAVKTTSPLSLSCTNLYQTPGLISNTMVSPGIGIYESETPSALGISSLIESQYGASKDISESNKVLNISSLEESNVKNKSLEIYSGTVDLSERDILNEGESNLDENKVEKNIDEKDEKKLDQTELKSIPASSMPCLDDSSSESFSEDASNQLTDVIQTKIYSPISMPILTDDLDISSNKKPEDDVSDLYPNPQSDASNSSKNESIITSEENIATEISLPATQETNEKVDSVEPAFIDDGAEQLIEQSNDTESNEKDIEENKTAQEENGDDHSVVETIVEEETPLMNMEQIEDSKLETLTEVTDELSDKLDNINTNDDDVNLVVPEEDKQEPLNNENEMDISETDISAVKEIDDLKSNVDVSISKSIDVTKDRSPMENNIDSNLNEECDEICAETPPHLLERESSIYDDEQVVSNEDLSKMQNEADGNSLPDHVCDDLNVSCSSESAALPDSTSPNLDISPATPEHPSESMHFSESSSDASTEIPIQPTISVSHHLVQNFSSMLNSVNPDEKCDDNNISDVSEHFDNNENTSPKSVKQNER